ncbi:MAG: cupin domain-containing protein [Acidimicrobiia bacterium]|nr:cupin domain-containing protein [Acidimicrobiia bacterium]MDH5294438.1 cupin domain-containing protein [Acidimicrobiia bacterium]
MSVIDGSGLEFRDFPGRVTADPLELEDSESSLRIVKLQRTVGRTAHRHPHSEEVFYVETGTGRVYIDGEFHPVKPGDTVRIPAGLAHATVPDEGVEMRLVCFFPHPDLPANSEDTGIEVS